eukprot:jgi/Botrbrau1/4767/Bobra.0137s0039.1
MFRIEPAKAQRVHDLLLSCGWVRQQSAPPAAPQAPAPEPKPAEPVPAEPVLYPRRFLSPLPPGDTPPFAEASRPATPADNPALPTRPKEFGTPATAVPKTPSGKPVPTTPADAALLAAPPGETVPTSPPGKSVSRTPPSQKPVPSTPPSKAVPSLPHSRPGTRTPPGKPVPMTPPSTSGLTTPPGKRVSTTPDMEPVPAAPAKGPPETGPLEEAVPMDTGDEEAHPEVPPEVEKRGEAVPEEVQGEPKPGKSGDSGRSGHVVDVEREWELGGSPPAPGVFKNPKSGSGTPEGPITVPW